MVNFPPETGLGSIFIEGMDMLTLLPSGTSVVFTSNVISTDLSLTIKLGNEIMAAVTVCEFVEGKYYYTISCLKYIKSAYL